LAVYIVANRRSIDMISNTRKQSKEVIILKKCMTIKTRKVADIEPDSLEANAKQLAGFLDGEGTFTVLVKKSRPLHFSPMIEAPNTDEQVIQWVAEILGTDYKNYVKKNKPYHKKIHYLRVTTQNEVKQICHALLPYAKTKRKQIMQLILDFFLVKETLPKRKNDPRRRDALLKMIDIWIEIKKLNNRGKPPDYERMRNELIDRI